MQRRRPSEGVEWQLVATLYDQTSTLVIGGLALPVVAVVAWFQTHQAWYLLWASGMILGLGARVGLQFAFRRRGAGPNRVRLWRRRFTLGAWLMGALWGIAAFGITAHADPLIETLLIAVQLVVIMGASARNSAAPAAVYGQMFFALTPLFVATLIDADRNYWTIGVLLLFQTFASLSIVHHLSRRTICFLETEECNAELLRQIGRTNADLADANERLAAAATTDALTGIANRRRFDDALAEESRRAARDGTVYSLLMVDIDAFKAYNDRHGHQAGDECLRRVAHALAAALRRPADVAARYGGEEFAAILPQTSTFAASALAETIRADIAALAIGTVGDAPGSISVSIGVATSPPDGRGRPGALLRAADAALYAAKHAGRNCVRIGSVAAVPDPAPTSREGAVL